VDPNLISSSALARAGRTNAARFAELPSDTTFTIIGHNPTTVAMIANESRSPLNLRTATAGALLIAGTNVSQSLQNTGILSASNALNLSSLRAVFQASTGQRT